MNAENMSKPLITIDHVSVFLGGRELLSDVCWNIFEGKNWAVIGPNASGKSVLVRLLTGALPHAKGRVIRHRIKAEADRIGYASFELQTRFADLAQRRDEACSYSGSEEGRLTAEQAVLFGLDSKCSACLPETAKLLEMDGLLHRPLGVLSNGEIRRILIARALIRSSGLLILDEPFAGLDARTAGMLAGMIETMMQNGVQLILTAQRMDEILPSISHVLGLMSGSVMNQGLRRAVLTHDNLEKLFPEPQRIHVGLSIPCRQAQIDTPLELVRMNHVSVRYGEQVIFSGLNWTFRAGENWALLGPNGTGKTTLMRLIYGEHPQAYANDVEVFGIRRGSGESVWDIKRHIGLVSPELQMRYQKPISARDVAVSGFFDSIGLYARPTKEQRAVAFEWLDGLGISYCADSRFTSLSYGEKQLVLLARAMVKSPLLLILDEPCQGLDPANRQKVNRAIEEIGRNSGVSLLYATHHFEEIPSCVNRILYMDQGRCRLLSEAECAGVSKGLTGFPGP